VGGIALLAAAFVAIVCLLFFGDDPTVQTPGETGPEQPAVDTSATTADSTVQSDAPKRELLETVAPANPEPGPLAADHMRVRGTVVVVDSKGVEHREEDGELKLVLWESNSGRHRDVTVEQGLFSVDLPSKVEIEVNNAVLGGRHANAPQERIPVREVIELRLTWSISTILRVVDAEYGLDLTEITVVAASNWQTDDCAHPGSYRPQDVRVEGERSPLELTIDSERNHARSQETLWVHSPGYTWGRLTVDYKNPTERRVELHRGGTLEVLVEGRLPKKRKPQRRRVRIAGAADADARRLRLRKAAEQPDIEAQVRETMERVAQLSDADLGGQPRPTEADVRKMFEQAGRGEMMFEASAPLNTPIVLKGVPPGTYVVAVEIGNHWDSPLILGETATTVEVGTTQYATVTVEPPPERTTVPLSGTFFLPPAWKESHLSLDFEPMDLVGKTPADERDLKLSDMKPDPATPGLYRWDAGLVVPGRYEVTCYTLDMQWVVDTGPKGNDRAEIRVGVPVDASVRVLEEATGRWIEDVVVHWNGARPEGVTGGSLERAKWNATTRIYEFRVAAGRVQVAARTRDYSTIGEHVFDVQPNSREFVIRVRRNCGVVLFLKHGDTVIPWEESTRFDLEIKTLEGARAGWGSGGSGENGMYLTVQKPGAYRVTVPDQPGFEPVPPIEIYVDAGKFTEHDVQLQRRR